MTQNNYFYAGPVGEGRVLIEVGRSYINRMGRLITLEQRKVIPSGWANMSGFYFVDSQGQRYLADGTALKSNKPGLESRESRRLIDRAQRVRVGERYEVHWKDRQSIGFYEVIELIDDRKYLIRWSNDAETHIVYGCPLNYDAVPYHFHNLTEVQANLVVRDCINRADDDDDLRRLLTMRGFNAEGADIHSIGDGACYQATVMVDGPNGETITGNPPRAKSAVFG